MTPERWQKVKGYFRRRLSARRKIDPLFSQPPAVARSLCARKSNRCSLRTKKDGSFIDAPGLPGRG
jgi:hypothetical protein